MYQPVAGSGLRATAAGNVASGTTRDVDRVLMVDEMTMRVQSTNARIEALISDVCGLADSLVGSNPETKGIGGPISAPQGRIYGLNECTVATERLVDELSQQIARLGSI